MSRRSRNVLLTCAGLVALPLGMTWLALEGGDVVRLHTRGVEGQARVTRVWIAEDQDVAWIEAATPERPFFVDLLRNPEVDVERNGERRRFLAESVANPDGHLRVRALLRAKYGWADSWIGLLQDTSRSSGVRLRPVDVAPSPVASRLIPPAACGAAEVEDCLRGPEP